MRTKRKLILNFIKYFNHIFSEKTIQERKKNSKNGLIYNYIAR